MYICVLVCTCMMYLDAYIAQALMVTTCYITISMYLLKLV